jgi:hypothetical protein
LRTHRQFFKVEIPNQKKEQILKSFTKSSVSKRLRLIF